MDKHEGMFSVLYRYLTFLTKYLIDMFTSNEVGKSDSFTSILRNYAEYLHIIDYR